jgi:2-polyprenyl-3-methyl-5-hydroxy-6-metoxy-1,4-benzoquinol methylase
MQASTPTNCIARNAMSTNAGSGPGTRKCPICDSTADFVFSAPDQSGQIPGVFSVYRCTSCGTGTTDIDVNNDLLHKMYDAYYDTQNVVRQYEHPLHRWYRRTHLQRITAHTRGRNLLDIGCGSGLFVKTASAEGFNAKGVDMSPASVECGRKIWNLDLSCATIEEFAGSPENAGRFDVITLYSVLEHVTSPRDTLAAVWNMLAVDGLLVAEVPNFASIQARAFGAHWFNLDVPRHLYHYSPDGLRRVVQSSGFDVVRVRPGPAAIDFGIAASLMRMPDSGESLAHKVVRKLVVTPFGRALVPLEHLLGSAGSVEVYARKAGKG